jgi:hypothetical protein
MKKITLILALMMSLVAFAGSKSMVFPRVMAWPNSVDVRVLNNTNDDVWCTGTIFITTRSGRMQTRYYNARVYKGMSDYKTFPNFNYQDPFRNASHSIRCNAY